MPSNEHVRTFAFCHFFLLWRAPPAGTLFPYTTLFRSILARDDTPTPAGVSLWDAAPLGEPALPDSAPASAIRDSLYDLIRSEEHTSELQSQFQLVCRLLLEKKNRSYHASAHD